MGWRVAQSLEVLRKQFNTLFPARSKVSDGGIGDLRHQASKSSDHNPHIKDKNGVGVVTARDFTHDPANGLDCNELAATLVKNRDPRIKYIIWNRRICSSQTSPWQWRPYSGVNAHTKHLHLSVKAEPGLYDSPRPWDLDDDVARVASTPRFNTAEIDLLADSIGPTSPVEDPAGSHASPPNEPAIVTDELPEPEADASQLADAAGEGEVTQTVKETVATEEGTRTAESTVTTLAGDAPDVPPSSFLRLEDWKPFTARWLKRVWGTVSTVTLPGGVGLGFAALKDPPNWFIYAAIGLVVIVILLGLGLIVSAVLLAIWYFNRKEISAGKTEAAKSLIDPSLKNMGVIIEPK